MGGRSSVTLPLTRINEPGRPTVLAAGRFLAPVGRYFPEMHTPVAAEELEVAVTAEIDAGATWLKLIGDFPYVGPDGARSGGMERTYDDNVVTRLIDLAHAGGARVAVHTQSVAASDLIRLGVDSVEHGELLTPDAVELLGGRGGAWTPTLSAILRIGPDSSPERRRRVAENSERLRHLLSLALGYGVRVLAGTDLCGTVAGEIALLRDHGLSVEQAIASASWMADDYLEIAPDEGSVVTYATDPREDPSVLHHPAAIVLRGVRLL